MTDTLVYVVDDDDAVRNAITLLLKSVGLSVSAFGDALEFLQAYDASLVSCVLMDVRMPGMSGVQAQQQMADIKPAPAIVFLSGHADVPVAVAAMKAGALDFIQKPFSDQELIDAVQSALQVSATRLGDSDKNAEYQQRRDSLTPRETQVMDRICAGQANKVVAAELNLSERTVEIHRANVMRKMQAKSVADLVSMQVSGQGKVST